MATQSKLAVILHADVVGSTALVRKDELLAHDRIRAAFEGFADTVRAYKGTVSEVRGDALVAEFARASDAVVAALAAQAANARRATTLHDDIVPQMRVGIALGEVVIADNTVTGSGVVLAQRLEQLAEPGGVCVQGSVYEAVSERLPLDYTNLGEQTLKGFDEPVRAFAVALRPGEILPEPEPVASTVVGIARARHRWIAGGAIALLLVVGAKVAWDQPWKVMPDSTSRASQSPVPLLDASKTGERTAEESEGRAAPPLPDKPSIAVLAFNNMSNDAEQEYFADGIAEDIITDLSKLSGLFVIARNSSFAYKGKNVSLKTIGRALGVKYVLEGSVRRSGDTLRVTAQLIDTATDSHVWAERFDGALSDVFGFQDTVTEKVVSALKVSLNTTETNALQAGGTRVIEAYDAFLIGMRELQDARRIGGVLANERAKAAFEKAISIDPSYAQAYAGLGWTYWTHVAFAFGYDHRAKIEKAWQLAQESLEIEDNALAHRLLLKRHLDVDKTLRRLGPMRNDYDGAIAQGRKAVALEPNSADSLAELAYVLAFAGETGEAERLIKHAKRLNPNFPPWYYKPAGIVEFQKGNYEQAIVELTKTQAADALTLSGYWLASAMGHAGKLEQAKKVLETVIGGGGMRGRNQYSIARLIPLKSSADMARFLEGLDKAGVPKEPQATN